MGAWVPVSPRATWATAGARERAQIPVCETVCSCNMKVAAIGREISQIPMPCLHYVRSPRKQAS